MKNLILASSCFLMVVLIGCGTSIPKPVLDVDVDWDFVLRREKPGCELTITSPANNQEIRSPFKLTQDKQIAIDVEVNCSCELNAKEYLTVFLSVQGGEETWVSGNPVRGDFIKRNTATIGYVTIGTPGDGNRAYDVIAALTKRKFRPGEKRSIDSLPKDMISDKVTVLKPVQ